MSIESGTPPRISSRRRQSTCARTAAARRDQRREVVAHRRVRLDRLNYTTGVLFRGTEPLLADLCRRCGTVVRLHVKQPDRNWVQN